MMKDKVPKVAVALAAFNGVTYIAEQLTTILQQDAVDVQVFISVDSSTDGTEQMLAKWACSEPRLVLLPSGQHFGGAARNFFRLIRDIDLSGFDYLSFADQDDHWYKTKLQRACCVLRETKASGYSSNVIAFWPSGKRRLVSKGGPQRAWDYLFESAGPGCTFVVDNALALALQKLVRTAGVGLEGLDYHDWLTYAFARAHGFCWVIDPRPSMAYRQHSHNQLGVNQGWRPFVLRAKKVLNGYAFGQARRIAEAIGVSTLPIVQIGLRGGRLGYVWLAFRSAQCRRQLADRMMFFVSCLLLAIINPAGV